jgi:hypothetical protein
MARIGLRERSDPRHISARASTPTPNAAELDPSSAPPVDPYLERILRARPRRPLDVPPWVDRLDERLP